MSQMPNGNGDQVEHNGNGNHRSDYLLRRSIVLSLCLFVILAAVLMAVLTAMGKQIPPELSLMASTAIGILGGVMSPNLRR